MGYFGFDGNLDSCIVIRTVILDGGKAYVQAGAGIVADSVPALEYEETRNKARGMLKAVALAERIRAARAAQAEGGQQKTDDRGQRTDGRRQKSEVGNRKSVRPKSKIKIRKSKMS